MELTSTDTLRVESKELRGRLAKLADASVRINEGLDLDDVLQMVADSARSLTGGRFGGITILHESGELERFVTSGMTALEHQLLSEVPHGLLFLAHLGSVNEPIRVASLAGYFRSVGLPEFHPPVNVKPCLVAPIRFRGQFVGCVHVANSASGPEFSDEDEAALTTLASQSGLAIVHARRCRDEQRARAELDTLIDTSPVGVLMLDVRCGVVVRGNREAERIISGLRAPKQAFAQVRDFMTIRRADGREVSLAELPLASVLAEGETIRAEKIVLARPGGRSLTALINATPIRSPDGDISSVVVTIQDMTLLEDLDHLRADLLGAVGEQLRAPLVAVKGAAATLLESQPFLNGAEATQLVRVIDSQADRIRDLIGDMADMARIETGTLVLDLEPTDPMQLLSGAAASPEFAGGGIVIDIAPDLPPVTVDRRRIMQALDIVLAVVNRSSHGAAPIRVTAAADGVLLRLEVSRDSSTAGPAQPTDLFDAYAADSMFDPISAAGLSGARVALCKGIVAAHGGRVRAERHNDGLGGIRTSLTLPLAQPPQALRGSRPSAPAMRILVVEAIPSTQRYLHDTLTNAGYRVAIVADNSEALAHTAEHAPDLILADMSPGGVDIADTVDPLRRQTEAPIIVTVGPGQDATGQRAIEAGATDYLVKRFSPSELRSRVRAALHRSASTDPTGGAEQLSVGFLTIDLDARKVAIAGTPVPLSATEYLLLSELAASAGRVLDHDELMRRVWRTDSSNAAGIVRSAIKRLRRKLGDNARNPDFIVTVPRMGYRIGSGTPTVAASEAHEPNHQEVIACATS